MPKEQKKRGRRAVETKRKLEQDDDEQTPKRHKLTDDHEARHSSPLEPDQPEEQQYAEYDEEAQDETPRGQPGEMPFYGMLDEGEQEYFKKADELLELNQFTDAEDRSTFLANVYKEAEGKELKLANSQSCSRLMERLIQLSTPAQLKALFQKFSTQ
jgi:nucleolar protein 9